MNNFVVDIDARNGRIGRGTRSNDTAGGEAGARDAVIGNVVVRSVRQVNCARRQQDARLEVFHERRLATIFPHGPLPFRRMPVTATAEMSRPPEQT